MGPELDPVVVADADQIVAPVPFWIRTEQLTSDEVLPSYSMIAIPVIGLT